MENSYILKFDNLIIFFGYITSFVIFMTIFHFMLNFFGSSPVSLLSVFFLVVMIQLLGFILVRWLG